MRKNQEFQGSFKHKMKQDHFQWNTSKNVVENKTRKPCQEVIKNCSSSLINSNFKRSKQGTTQKQMVASEGSSR